MIEGSQKKPSFLVLVAMLVLLPAIGSSTETLLQDTLKSSIASIFVLVSAIYLTFEKKEYTKIALHPISWVFTLAALFSLSSIFWSHAYLAGVEFSRWVIFSIIFVIASKSINPSNFRLVSWSVHLGACIAALWASLQFWFDFQAFAQGPGPASTFVNKNFFAEFLVCTIPFSLLVIFQAKEKITAYLLAFSLGFNLASLVMTGTRSAFIATLLIFIFMPYPIWLNRRFYCANHWKKRYLVYLTVFLFVGFFGVGSIKTNNPGLISELGRITALERATSRANTLNQIGTYTEGSFSVRTSMWMDTLKMIKENIFLGVGAGAWEIEAPLYQAEGKILETDYYAHNEALQFLAEFGLLGLSSLLLISAYLFSVSIGIFKIGGERLKEQETPLRITALSSILAFLIISNAGFPLRLATTGILFTLSIAILAGSDLRLGLYKKYTIFKQIHFQYSLALIRFTLAALLVIAAHISYQAVRVEDRLVNAIRIGLAISKSKEPNHPKWMTAKQEMLTLAQEGVSINPHYRKLTPIIADSLASWGDWKNAVWFWESILSSRPYVPAIIINIAKGHIAMGNYSIADTYIERARRIQPNAKSLAYVEILLLMRTKRERLAETKIEVLLDKGWKDKELLQLAYSLGRNTNNTELLIKTLKIGIAAWPEKAVDGWLKLGNLYATSGLAGSKQEALHSYQSALAITPKEYRVTVWSLIPIQFQKLLEE